MKLKKYCYFLFFIFLFILISNYLFTKVYADTEVYEYDGTEYTFTFTQNGAASKNFSFDSENGLIDFHDTELEIAYDGKSYILINSSTDELKFGISELSKVEEFYTYKEDVYNLINDDKLYNVDEARSYALEEFDYIYFDVSMDLDENKKSVNSFYLSFVYNVMFYKHDNFADLIREDYETLQKVIYKYYEIDEYAEENFEYMISDLGYDSSSDFLEDVNYKVMFDENKEFTLQELKGRIRYHDGEEIYAILEDAVLEMNELEYNSNSEDMSALFNSLCESLYTIQANIEESILFFQERVRFYNYFSEFYEKAKVNNTYDEEGFNKISELIQEYGDLVDSSEEYIQIVTYKESLLEEIRAIPIKQVESDKGRVSVDGTLSSDATLTITEVENKGNSEKAYDISIDASTESEGNTYSVEIYDVDLSHADIEVYRIYNGEKIKLHSAYVNNCLSVETDTLGTIYVVRKLNAPWGQMAIVFGILFSLLIGTIIFFSVDGKKHERRI